MKRNQTTDICNNTDESQTLSCRRKKPGSNFTLYMRRVSRIHHSGKGKIGGQNDE